MKDQLLRDHLVHLLKGDGAHVDFDAAIKDLPVKLRGAKPAGVLHSPWELLEHLRIAQRDLLDSMTDPKHVSPEFPDGYWPRTATPVSAQDWDSSVNAFRTDLEALVGLISTESTDLLAPLRNTDGYTVMRKVMLAADHTSYHLGELVLLRRTLSAWT
jgi:DinB family protein